MSTTLAEFEKNNSYVNRIPACFKKNHEDLITPDYKKYMAIIDGCLDSGITATCISGIKNPIPFIWGAVIGLGTGMTMKSSLEIFYPTAGYRQDWKNWLEKSAALNTYSLIPYFLCKIAIIGALFTAFFKCDNVAITFLEGLVVGCIIGSELRSAVALCITNRPNQESVPLL